MRWWDWPPEKITKQAALLTGKDVSLLTRP
jgi:hypothetical protein